MLKTFKRAGIKKFHRLDIWREVNWEQLRQMALAKNISDIDEMAIIPPSRFQRNYHEFTVDGINVREVFRKAKRYLARKILP